MTSKSESLKRKTRIAKYIYWHDDINGNGNLTTGIRRCADALIEAKEKE